MGSWHPRQWGTEPRFTSRCARTRSPGARRVGAGRRRSPQAPPWEIRAGPPARLLQTRGESVPPARWATPPCNPEHQPGPDTAREAERGRCRRGTGRARLPCPAMPAGPSRAGGPIPLHNSGRTKAAVLSPRARSPANRPGGNISASARRPPPHPFWAIKKVQLPARPDNAAALPLELGNEGGCGIRPQRWHRARRPEGGMGGQRAPCSPAGGWRAPRVEPVSPAGSGDGYLGQCPKRSRRDGKSPLAAA